MIYRDYGKTGKKVSLLGFGGMRFKNVDDHDECVRLMVAAAEGGINYFDTAPGYFESRSETVYGKGFAEFRKRGLPYYCATKTFATTESDIRKEIDAQLKRLDIPSIDFYHIWNITTLDDWEKRKKDGILQSFKKLKDEGLIKHICISSHLIKDEINQLLMEGVFEGVLFGYSAYNFRTREAAFNAIKENKLGSVVMNPLGGGVIPDHPDLFTFLRREGAVDRQTEDTAAMALRFLWDHPDISVTLVGFDTIEHLKNALRAMEDYTPRTAAELEEVKSKASASFEGICTGCAYCVAKGVNCPVDIPIPQYMDTYNQKLLNKNSKDPIGDRLKWHWSLDRAGAGKCIECGQCEAACTQHINIIERLKEIAG